MEKLNEKLVIHSQDERANRLKYLVSEFRKRKTFDQVGVSDTHMCLIQLLMLLSTNPTGAGGGIDDFSLPTSVPGIGGVHDNLPRRKEYLSRAEVERINQEQFDQHLKDLQDTPEMREIRRVKRQWEREMEEEDSSFSSLDSAEDLDEGHI
jgi:hypothetical protein